MSISIIYFVGNKKDCLLHLINLLGPNYLIEEFARFDEVLKAVQHRPPDALLIHQNAMKNLTSEDIDIIRSIRLRHCPILITKSMDDEEYTKNLESTIKKSISDMQIVKDYANLSSLLDETNSLINTCRKKIEEGVTVKKSE